MTKLPSAEELDEELQTVGTQEKALELIHAYTIAVLEVLELRIHNSEEMDWEEEIRALKEDL